jgi:hypothetical protein
LHRPAVACAIAGLCFPASSTPAVAQGFREIFCYDAEVVFEPGGSTIVTESIEVRALRNEIPRGSFTTPGLSSALGSDFSITFSPASSAPQSSSSGGGHSFSSGGGGLSGGGCWQLVAPDRRARIHLPDRSPVALPQFAPDLRSGIEHAKNEIGGQHPCHHGDE